MSMNSLRQLLRAEIRLPSSDELVRAFTWIKQGLGVFLPERIRQSGWRPCNRLIYLSTDQNCQQAHTIEVSRFGERRRNTGDGSPSLPTHVALNRDSYFMTHLSLPAEAARNFAKAATLRLAEISPIPPEDAAIAVGNINTDRTGRASADIAITRKKELQAIRERYASDNLETIGAAADENGVLEFVFSRKNSEPSGGTKRRFVNAGLLAASIVFLLIAVDVHQQRRLQALSDHETQTLSSLRLLRPAAALFQGVGNTTLEAAAGQPVNQAINRIDSVLGALPDASIITRLDLNAEAISVSGLAPSGAAAPSAAPMSTTPSDYPGFDRFEMTNRLVVAP